MRGNPYAREVALKHSVVAFFDLLGFAELTRAAYERGGNEPSQLLSRVRASLQRAATYLQDGEWIDKLFQGADRLYALRGFSDNIVLAYPIQAEEFDTRHVGGELELGSVTTDVAAYQLSMTLDGFFLRGGIAVGDAYIDDTVIFGDGLLEAYRGEHETAKTPRVVLTPSAVEYMRNHIMFYDRPESSPYYYYVTIDQDGEHFLNYLYYIFESESDMSLLERHREVVVQKLQESKGDERVHSKYVWVARYHNYFCRQIQDGARYTIVPAPGAIKMRTLAE